MSELRDLVRARLIRMRDVDLRETPGLIAQPELRQALETIMGRALTVLGAAFGKEALMKLVFVRAEIHEMAQIDELDPSLAELAVALVELDVTVEAFRQLLGIDGDAITRVVMSTDEADEAIRLVTSELQRQGST